MVFRATVTISVAISAMIAMMIATRAVVVVVIVFVAACLFRLLNFSAAGNDYFVYDDFPRDFCLASSDGEGPLRA